MARISVIGAGSWGIALAWRLFNNGAKVTIWARSEKTVENLRINREDKE